MFPIQLFGVTSNPAKSVRTVGVIFDKNYTFHSHISTVCSSCFYHMRDLRCIRYHLHVDSSKLLGMLLCPIVLIIAIHFCTVSPTLTSLGFTRVQDQLAHLVTKSPPFTRSLPLLRSLHWLRVRIRILFKINLLTYKTLHEKRPVYLHSMLAVSLPSHSNNDNSLSVPRFKTNTGVRAFHSCASSL